MTTSSIIAFHLYDKTDGKFKKVYFQEWHDKEPIFNLKSFAKKYWNEKLAEEDIVKLKSATSQTAITLNIRLEELK